MRHTARTVVIEFAELSDPGRDPSKQVNEDSSGYAPTALGHLAVVCDGMGGHAAGQHASRLAVDVITRELAGAAATTLPAQALGNAVQSAARAVHALGGRAPADVRPGSTCVAVLIHEQGADVAHVGDSRVYWVHAGRITRVTRDHSMVQQMVDAGVLSAAEASDHPDSNKITRALGMDPDVEVEVRPQPLALSEGDVLLLATDGVTDLLEDHEILATVQRLLPSGPAVVCQELVRVANERGGHDNITVQALQIVSAPPRPQLPTLSGEPEAVRSGLTAPMPSDAAGAARMADLVAPRGGPPPTIVDGSLAAPGTGDRNTEPGLVPGAVATRARFADTEARQAADPRQSRRLLVWGGAACVMIVLAVVGWWLLRSVRSKTEEVPPPPALEPTTSARPGRAKPPEPASLIPDEEAVPTAPPTEPPKPEDRAETPTPEPQKPQGE